MRRSEDIRKMIQAYFIRKIEAGVDCVDVVDTSAELIQLLGDLPSYNMDSVEKRLEEKRYWDAAKIVREGWK